MYGYKLSFEGLPTIAWAAETKMDNYSWHAEHHKENTLEIGIIKAPKHTMMINGKSFVFHDSHLLTCVAGMEKTSDFAEPGVPVRITTIAVNFPKLHIISGEITASDCNDDSILILPRYLDFYSEEYITEITLLMHNFIKHSTKDSLADYSICMSLLFQVITKIDSEIRKMFLATNEKSHHYYIRKIHHIVHRDYEKKISQASVAKELGISSSYLSTMYKKATGKTFSEYLLQTRMNRAAELLESSNLSTVEISNAVGFDDESHFRKRFKEYFGMNVREYRYIQKGMTLYHPLPLREQQTKEP